MGTQIKKSENTSIVITKTFNYIENNTNKQKDAKVAIINTLQNNLYILLGIKPPELPVLAEYANLIYTYHKEMRIQDLKIAFNLFLVHKLDLEFADYKIYNNNLSIDIISKIINSYKRIKAKNEIEMKRKQESIKSKISLPQKSKFDFKGLVAKIINHKKAELDFMRMVDSKTRIGLYCHITNKTISEVVLRKMGDKDADQKIDNYIKNYIEKTSMNEKI